MKTEIKWHGLRVRAIVELDNWEGDPSVPNGVHYLNPYAEEIEVLLPDGYSFTDEDLSDPLWAEIEELLIEAAKNDQSMSMKDYYDYERLV